MCFRVRICGKTSKWRRDASDSDMCFSMTTGLPVLLLDIYVSYATAVLTQQVLKASFLLLYVLHRQDELDSADICVFEHFPQARTTTLSPGNILSKSS